MHAAVECMQQTSFKPKGLICSWNCQGLISALSNFLKGTVSREVYTSGFLRHTSANMNPEIQIRLILFKKLAALVTTVIEF